MRELTEREVEQVAGVGVGEAAAAFGTLAGLGMATFGASWGSVGVGLAFAVSPVAVVAMGGLALYAGYLLMC